MCSFLQLQAGVWQMNEAIHVKIITAVSASATARTKVMIFCKSRPLNWQFEDNNQSKQAS